MSVMLTGYAGVRRQLGHPVPRDFRQERQQRRASLLDHGSPDQGAHGQHHRQQQADGPGRPGLERAVGQRWRLLLSWIRLRQQARLIQVCLWVSSGWMKRLRGTYFEAFDACC